ncbi:MAG: response regulator [Alphaproteobacteria bacterium]|nr:response regulator [Alphaproteobacteria bacterium]
MRRILLIEDDVHMHNMLTILLERHNYAVDVVFDGKDGIEKVKENNYLAVITDLHLADMNGLGVIDSIREVHENLPIIAISGGDYFRDGDLRLLDKAREMDINGVFTKPFEHHDLLNCLNKSVEQYQASKSKKGFFAFFRYGGD